MSSSSVASDSTSGSQPRSAAWFQVAHSPGSVFRLSQVSIDAQTPFRSALTEKDEPGDAGPTGLGSESKSRSISNDDHRSLRRSSTPKGRLLAPAFTRGRFRPVRQVIRTHPHAHRLRSFGPARAALDRRRSIAIGRDRRAPRRCRLCNSRNRLYIDDYSARARSVDWRGGTGERRSERTGWRVRR